FRLFIAHLRLDKTPNLGVHQTGSSSVLYFKLRGQPKCILHALKRVIIAIFEKAENVSFVNKLVARIEDTL
ncbi:hypothetical protein, partial [Bradyrhizobium denitrificans]|uniref:hypothetical protein n=1 Tax=Bradyrhizobium denitrificans TaxID=2734912 RepID=UPI0020232FB8